MTLTAIRENIAKDAIAGHEAAIDKLIAAMNERYENYDPNVDRLEPCFYAQQDRDMQELKILMNELMQMKGRSVTFLLMRSPHGWLTEGLGANLDIGMYHESQGSAWRHLAHMISRLKEGKA